MSLEKTLANLAAKQKTYSPFCAFQVTLNSMPEKDQKALQDAWEKGYSVNIILKALRAEGYKATQESIKAHKQGSCKCPK